MELLLAAHRTNLDRRHQLGTEFQGLEVTPVGQIRTGQARGETHVVLDPRAGPRLASRAEPVQDDRGEPLGGAVDRRREAGGTGSNDHQIEWLRADLPLQAQALGNSTDRGPRRPRAPVAGDERQLLGGDPQRLHRCLAVRIIGIDPGVRHLVLVEELTDLRQMPVTDMAEDANADETRLLQHDPARLERLEQLVAEVGDLLDDAAQLALADAVGPGFAPGVGRDGGGAVGQERDVACELVRAVHDDRPRVIGRFVHDGDLARLDDVKRQTALPGLEDELTVLERANRRQFRQAFDLGITQPGKRELMNVIDCRHGLELLETYPSAPPQAHHGPSQKSSPYPGPGVNPFGLGTALRCHARHECEPPT